MFQIPKGYEKYCKPSFFCESDDKEIRHLAQEIAKENRTKEDVAKNFYLRVRDEIGWNVCQIRGAKNILKKKPSTAICFDHVNLFNALCRSVFIPARYKFVWCEFDFKEPGLPRKMGHVVSEVFLDGDWVMVDPTFGAKDSKIINIHGFGKPNWEESRDIFTTANVPRAFVSLFNFWVRTHPKARKIRKIVNSIHE